MATPHESTSDEKNLYMTINGRTYVASPTRRVSMTTQMLIDIANDPATQPAYRRGMFRAIAAFRAVLFDDSDASEAVGNEVSTETELWDFLGVNK